MQLGNEFLNLTGLLILLCEQLTVLLLQVVNSLAVVVSVLLMLVFISLKLEIHLRFRLLFNLEILDFFARLSFSLIADL